MVANMVHTACVYVCMCEYDVYPVCPRSVDIFSIDHDHYMNPDPGIMQYMMLQWHGVVAIVKGSLCCDEVALS